MSETVELAFLVDGRLADLSRWDKSVAEEIAQRDGLTLSDEHWTVIRVMREYYDNYKISPVKKLLKRELRKQLKSEQFDDDKLDALFPGSVQVQGTKIAGIPIAHLDVELETAGTRATKVGAKAQAESIDFDGEQIALTLSGNLVDLHRWNEALAEVLADKEDIKLTPEHWVILNYLREFYFKYGITPMVKILMRHLAEERGAGLATKDHLYALFPKGPSRQGSRIAGLPEPQGCIDFDE